MQQELLPYLLLHKGVRLENILPDIRILNDNYRFDSNRFDILAVHKTEDIFYGIKLLTSANYKSLQKIVDDSNWFKQYNGTSIILIPQDKKEYWNIFNEETSAGLIIPKYYYPTKSDYVFADDPRQKFQESINSSGDKVLKMIQHPQLIDGVLRTFEKKSPLIKFARIALNAYHKANK